MMAISMFGAMFTWLMIFVTHYCFRRRWNKEGGRPLAFRMWGFPVLTLLGAGLMLAIMATTLFTDEFKATLLTGIPFVAVLSVVYFVWYRNPQHHELEVQAPEVAAAGKPITEI